MFSGFEGFELEAAGQGASSFLNVDENTLTSNTVIWVKTTGFPFGPRPFAGCFLTRSKDGNTGFFHSYKLRCVCGVFRHKSDTLQDCESVTGVFPKVGGLDFSSG